MLLTRLTFRRVLCAILLIGPLSTAHAGSAGAPADWKSAADRLATGETLQVEDVPHVDPDLPAEDLVLTRFEITTPDAVLRLDGEPHGRLRDHLDRTYLKGQLAGEPGSSVTVVIDDQGHARGLVRMPDGGMQALIETGAGARLTLAPVASELDAAGFACGTENLTGVPESSAPRAASGTTVAGIPAEGYLARLAIETDHEYYLQFGNTQDATDYAADLVAFSSTVYSDEVETALAIGDLSLWTTPGDPWTQSGAGCLMYEFGRYWNDNNDAIDRTTAHLLSGRGGRSGIAWVGVLCNGEFTVNIGGNGCSLTPNTDNYGGAYGVTKGLDGNFDLGNPQSVWDIVAFAHEVGHNFNSPHTHCYNGIGGNSNPIDECYNGQADDGCYAGTQQLPGPSGQGSGTLMSYCHLLSPGLSNISLTLGEGHGFGVQPERAPDRMLSHVMNRASVFPQCLAVPQDETVFGDGFESPDG